MSALVDNLVGFGRLLRAEGLAVHPGRVIDLAEALQHMHVGVRDEVYHACRVLLVHRRDDLATFDRVFTAFWRRHEHDPTPAPGPRSADGDAADAPSPAGPEWSLAASAVAVDAAVDDVPAASLPSWSSASTLAEKDFASYTPEEIALARGALDRLAWTPGLRRTRRWVRGRGPRVDLRRALASGLRSDGEVLSLPTRMRRLRPRPLVLVCDISGSMERYTRMLLQFAHALRRRSRRVEAFVFATTLTRVTREIRGAHIDRAVADVSRVVPDWSGGTRIGEALRHLHTRWGRRALHGRPVVLLVSDGWDRGEPEELRAQIQRLQRNSHRLIWLNPLIGTHDYAPLTRGLQAALPFVDDFLPVRTLTNLAELALHLNRLPKSR